MVVYIWPWSVKSFFRGCSVHFPSVYSYQRQSLAFKMYPHIAMTVHICPSGGWSVRPSVDKLMMFTDSEDESCLVLLKCNSITSHLYKRPYPSVNWSFDQSAGIAFVKLGEKYAMKRKEGQAERSDTENEHIID